MADEISIIDADNLTYYAVVRNAGQYLNGTALEAYNTAHWSSYAIAMTKTVQSAGVSAEYQADFPAAPAKVAPYRVDVYLQAGGSPSVSADGKPVYSGQIFWNGSAETNLANVITSNPAIQHNVIVTPAT